MANRQLVAYVKEQLAHKMDVNAIRTLLLQQGWSQEDVEAAVEEAYRSSRQRTHREHHTNFVAVAVAGVVVVILAVALFLVAFREQKPDPEVPLIVPNPPDDRLTGWAVCAHEEDSVAKHACYYDLNDEEELYDCYAIDDPKERGFCLRATEAVLLERYEG
ncbi:hypothetical protein JXA12_03625 [Candidatus Woesearchaeota archaeon]|nr:hypothetical protein [Candidatus Woesearchaeota archaeon]